MITVQISDQMEQLESKASLMADAPVIAWAELCPAVSERKRAHLQRCCKDAPALARCLGVVKGKHKQYTRNTVEEGRLLRSV